MGTFRLLLTALALALAIPLDTAWAVNPPGDSAFTSSDPQYSGSLNFQERYSWGRNWFGGITVPTGAPVRVYVLDGGGVGNHEDINLVQRVNLNIDPTTGTPVNPVGCYAHGTHVAGIIGARRGNRGTAGMAAGVQIISVSVAIRNGRNPANSVVLDCGTTPAPDGSQSIENEINASYINALNWIKSDIISNGGGRTAIVNISQNDPRFKVNHTSGIAAKIGELATQVPGYYPGALVVQSAGNFGAEACDYAYGPQSNSDGVLVVGGLTNEGRPPPTGYLNDDDLIPSSNYGNCVEVWAPSTDIWSTYATGPYDTTSEQTKAATRYFNPGDSTYWQRSSQYLASYRVLSGTSMAAPHVAGLAVGFLLENPTQSPSALEGQIRTRAFVNYLNTFGATYVIALSPFTEHSTWDGLLTGYYATIFGRAIDEGGRAFWDAEIARLVSVATDAREAFRAVAKAHFFSAEYQTRNPMLPAGSEGSDPDRRQFITDMYLTFYQRAPDAGGLNYWAGQMASGLNREAAFLAFAFSVEFDNFMTARLGYTEQREEVSYIIDAYRGAFGRLPDPAGFRWWRDRLRAAQCQGTAWSESQNLINSFFGGTEQQMRNRSDKQFVADQYDAFFRAVPDAAGLNYWTGRLNGTTGPWMSRAEMTNTFFGYAGTRIQRIASLPCIPCTQLPGGYCQ